MQNGNCFLENSVFHLSVGKPCCLLGPVIRIVPLQADISLFRNPPSELHHSDRPLFSDQELALRIAPFRQATFLGSLYPFPSPQLVILRETGLVGLSLEIVSLPWTDGVYH